jgi:hypothetical protein
MARVVVVFRFDDTGHVLDCLCGSTIDGLRRSEPPSPFTYVIVRFKCDDYDSALSVQAGTQATLKTEPMQGIRHFE